MQYKTTIEVYTDAGDKFEAADIAGEFLKGDIAKGADLKVKTSTIATTRTVKAVMVVALTSLTAGAFLLGNQFHSRMAKVETKPVTSYAIQPPLKTNMTDSQSQEFKKIWEEAQEARINSK